MLFVSVDTDDEAQKRIIYFFDMKEEELPGMRIFKKYENMARFKPGKFNFHLIGLSFLRDKN